ncbi:MAG TPA: PQQ-dependent sugar dehydrogenase, partial [Polyangiales bacterium]|nr:PQQ-dependent sugar dehydrogenase [Polyangiales bacterium]
MRFVLVALIAVVGCSDTGFDSVSGDGSNDPSGIDGSAASEEAIEQKGGLDGPPVPVGPFLDGVFPVRTPNAPGSSDWQVTQAFTGLTNLGDTLVISSNPSNDRIYVGSRDGFVRSFPNDPNVTEAEVEPFIDLTDRAWAVWDGGFLGLIFHPEFGQPGSEFRNYFYVYYSSHCQIKPRADGEGLETDLASCDPSVPKGSTNGFFGAYLRLSRFEVPDGSTIADPTSEKVMINMRLYNGSHRGGGMVFRNDGYLVLTIGDQFKYLPAQNIVDNLEGGSMRLAVDVTSDGQGGWVCPAGSHLPRRIYDTTDEISGQWYCIPDDNPWLDVNGGNFEEYCSIGHRNPHRLAWDPVTDYMWSGEVGENSREEINVIFCGNNYGWPFREGLIAGPYPEPASYIGTLTDPVIDFVRTEARAIIGGYVYRGTRYPELYGRYLAGDYVTGNIWAITLDPSTMTATKEYLTEFTPGGLGTWGQDRNGETFMGDVIGGGPIWELERIGQLVPDPPAYLSQLGAFDDLTDLTPSPVWVPYTLNQPFWSDAALKSRWIAVPNDGVRDTPAEQIGFAESSYWQYPVGTVLMKHFDLGLDESDPSVTTRLETRFMVLGDDQIWYALTYRWLPDQSDAVLLTTGETDDYTIQLAGGGTRNQTWSFPSRQECMDCHRQESGGALGPRTHQLNGDFFYESSGRTDNQLLTWNDLGMFTPALDPAAIPGMLRSRALGDVTASLEDRARSWLDSNCSSCHQPGTGIGGFDTRFWTPLEAQGLLWGPVRNDLGIPGLNIITPGDPDLSSIYLRMEAVGGIAMPPLAKSLAEQPGVELMSEWILRVDSSAAQSGVHYDYFEASPIDSLADLDVLTPVRTSTTSGFDISVRDRDDDFGFRFTAWLRVQTGGSYTFFTNSDDGSQLFINGALVVDNGGLHAPQERQGTISLASGYHEIEVTMFERAGGEVLDVSWQGPDNGNVKGPIGYSSLFLSVPSPSTNNPPTLTNPGDQSTTAGDNVVLSLAADDPDGDFLFYQSDGLPEGLSLDSVTGQITGVPLGTGTTSVTAGVSDGPEVDWVEFNWTIQPGGGGSFCGDGALNAGEECDDGNNTAGDGCAPDCTIEPVAVCGDGIVTAPETCEPPGTEVCDGFCQVRVQVCGDGFVTAPETCEPPGTDTCNDSCTARTQVCGDGFLTAPETCEDGNTVSGDGCSSTCQLEGVLLDVTQDGTPIAAVPAPLGGGNKDIEIIRDGDKPAPGTSASARQYD